MTTTHNDKLFRIVHIRNPEVLKALPEGTHVVALADPVLESPLIMVKGQDGLFYDWEANGVSAEDVGPIDALVEVPLLEEDAPELDVSTLKHIAQTMRETIGDEIPVGPAQTGAFNVTLSWAAWMDQQAALRAGRL